MKNSFVLYTSYQEHIDLLTMEQRGQLLTAILAYAAGNELPDMDGIAKMAFSFIREDMDKNEERYQKTVESRREAGKKGGRPKANAFEEKQKKQMVFSESKGKQKNPDNEDVYVDDYVDTNVSKKISVRFTPPTTEEVREYIREKGYNVDAEKFVDFYESKGWMVGKNKMKDWKASVRTWARSQREEKTAKGTRGFDNFTPSGTDWDAVAENLWVN